MPKQNDIKICVGCINIVDCSILLFVVNRNGTQRENGNHSSNTYERF